jgi:hypothetical protein
MKVDSMSFPESIYMPKSKCICGGGDRHNLLPVMSLFQLCFLPVHCS